MKKRVEMIGKLSQGSEPISQIILCVLVACVAWLSVCTWPFLDRTESRVVVIAQHLFDGSWFNLRAPVDNVWSPYWAKPPLHYWLTALSLKTGLPTEVAARLPGLFSFFITLVATGWMARVIFNKEVATLSVFVLASSCLFFFGMPLALIDSTLCSSLTVALAAFLMGKTEHTRSRAKLYFLVSGVALGVGVVAKGPIALALPFCAVLIAIPLRAFPREIYISNLSSALGGVFLLALPIYGLVEYHSPGFLRYFLVSENLQRYLSNQQKLLSGSLHSQPYGTAILYFVLCGLPWSMLLPGVVSSYLKETINDTGRFNQGFLLAWVLSPITFFLFARNVLATYFIPSLPALAILVSNELVSKQNIKVVRNFASVGLVILFVTILIAALSELPWGLFIFSAVAAVIALILNRDILLAPGGASIYAPVLSLFIALTGIACASQHIIEDFGSTRDVLRDLAKRYDPKNWAVQFPQGIPYSAYIYSSFVMYGEQLPEENPLKLIVVTRHKQTEFSLRDVFSERSDPNTDGKWEIRTPQ